MLAPRARTEDLLIQPSGDELLLYDLEGHRAHCLNRTAALVWRNCDGQTSVADLAEALERDAEVPKDEEVVLLALEGLWRAGLLLDEPPSPSARCTRRRLASRLGLTAGVAALLPVVSSIVAPTAAQAASPGPPGPPLPGPGPGPGNGDDDDDNLLPLVGIVPGAGLIAAGAARRRRRRRGDQVIQK